MNEKTSAKSVLAMATGWCVGMPGTGRCSTGTSPDQDSRLTRHDGGCWYQTGNYFQQLDAAVLWAYERVLREERPNRAQDLRDALDEARAIAAGLKAAAEEAQAALG